MYTYVCIFGRTGALSLLELQALSRRYGLFVDEHSTFSATIRTQEPLTDDQVLELQQRLGGTVRIVEWCGTVNSRQLVDKAFEVLNARAGEGKLTVGLSIHATGDGHTNVAPFRVAKPLKERLRTEDRSVRIVTPQAPATLLNAGTLTHNKLVGSTKAFELFVELHNGSGWLGITRSFQDVADYTERDFGIPVPDPVSGMLPPKLAQIMINLAVRDKHLHVHDPFCGNGRVVLEAALMGLPVSGSDIEASKVDASQKNLAWLSEKVGLNTTKEQIWVGDATDADNCDRISANAAPDYVLVGEPYLGKPLRAPLKPEESVAWLKELVPLFENYFTTWADANPQPQSHLLIMPRAKVADGSEMAVFNAVVDRLHQVGYSAEVLFCYDRPDSIVRRDIVAITKTQLQ